MPWFKVDDQLAFNAKVMLAGNSAMGLWVRAGSWSSGQLTGGFIPAHMANAMANPMANPCDPDALAFSGLWREVEGGYQFHDWEDFQPDAELEKKKRKETSEARSAAGKAGAAARWAKEKDGKPSDLPKQTHGKSNGKPMATQRQTDAPVPTRPDPLAKAKEREASPAPPAPKKGHRIPDGWIPSDDIANAMVSECPNVNQQMEYRKFVDYWSSQPGAKGVKLDWNATYRNWIRRASESAPKTGNRSTDRMMNGYEAMAGFNSNPQPDPWAGKELTQ